MGSHVSHSHEYNGICTLQVVNKYKVKLILIYKQMKIKQQLLLITTSLLLMITTLWLSRSQILSSTKLTILFQLRYLNFPGITQILLWIILIRYKFHHSNILPWILIWTNLFPNAYKIRKSPLINLQWYQLLLVKRN